MFACPRDMVKDYMTEIRTSCDRYNYALEQIEDYKIDAVKRLYKLVDPDYAEALAQTIAYGYENELESAIELVNKFGLSEKHIAALNNDSDLMLEILTEEAIDENNYENEIYGE